MSLNFKGISQETYRWHIVKANGYQGFIDSIGNEIYTDRFDILLDHYNNGLVFFKRGNESGFLDENGQVVFNINIHLSEFSNGLCCINKDKDFYYINSKGEVSIDLQNLEIPKGKELSQCFNFHNDLAAIRIQNIDHKDSVFTPTDVIYDYNIYPGDWFYGFINKDGKWVIKPNLDDVTMFKDGIAIIQKDGKFHFVDTLGKIKTTVKYDNAINISEGFALVHNASTWFYINRIGKKICDLEFENAETFSEGRAAIEINGKWGFIDTSGKIVIEPQYFLVNSFSDGLASVSLAIPEKGYFLNTYFIEGYIDKSGITKLPFEKNIDYDYRGFKNGISKGRRFIHTEDKKYTGYYELFYINKKGVKIWSEILKQ